LPDVPTHGVGRARGHGPARSAIAQPATTATLRFMPQSSLPMLDPMFSSKVAELTYLIQLLLACWFRA